MTVSTEMWYTGYDPYTLEPIFSAKTQREKLAQRQFFFWYKPEERAGIERELTKLGRRDLLTRLYSGHPQHARHVNFDNRAIGSTLQQPKAGRKVSKEKNKKSFNPNFAHGNHRKPGKRQNRQ